MCVAHGRTPRSSVTRWQQCVRAVTLRVRRDSSVYDVKARGQSECQQVLCRSSAWLHHTRNEWTEDDRPSPAPSLKLSRQVTCSPRRSITHTQKTQQRLQEEGTFQDYFNVTENILNSLKAFKGMKDSIPKLGLLQINISNVEPTQVNITSNVKQDIWCKVWSETWVGLKNC